MSTRSTLTIRTDNSVIHFYRHYDGYVAEAGQTIQVALEEASKVFNPHSIHPHFRKFVNIIMSHTYKNHIDENTLKMSDRLVYELIDDPKDHSDREYHYDVYFNDAGYPTITVEAWVPNFDEITQRHEVVFKGRFNDYKDLVTKEKAIIAERIAELEKKRGA